MSILEIADGVFEVKSTAGDNHLGGDNFDKAIVDWLAAEFKRDNGIDLSVDKMALQRLYEAAEKAKIELSTTATAQINLPFITADAGGPKHLDISLSRAKLEELVADLLDRLVGPTKQAIADSGKAGAIDHIVLVGGMTRMPAVQERVKQLTGKEPHKGVNPDEVVAIGAAIQGGVLAGEVVHGEVLLRGQVAARNLAADHEHVMLADARLGAVLTRVAVLLLIAAVKLDEVLVAIAQVIGVAEQCQCDGAAQSATIFLGDFDAGTLFGRLAQRVRSRSLRFVGHV